MVYEAYETKKKRENYAVFYFAGKIKMFFYIYDVITLEILKKRSIYHYIYIYIYIYIYRPRLHPDKGNPGQRLYRVCGSRTATEDAAAV